MLAGSFLPLLATLLAAGKALAVPLSSSSSAASSSSAVSTSSAAPVSSSAAASSLSSVLASSTSSSAAAASSSAWTVPAGWKVASAPCIAEGSSGRALTWMSTSSSKMTIESCLAYCDAAGQPLAGLEFAGECYCGGVLANGASLSAPGTCNTPCNGDSGRMCGGSGALSLYVSAGDSASTLSSDYKAQTLALTNGWTAMGCYSEGTTGRALDGLSYSSPALNTQYCLNLCFKRGFSMAGLEYGGECYCDTAFRNGGGAVSKSCNMPCTGGPGQTCGGPGALTVYYNPTIAPSSSQSNGYNKQGCVQEVPGRALTGASLAADTMTVDTCTSFCRSKSMTYAAVEYGRECYCGNSFSNGASLTKYSSQCTIKCQGDKSQQCGGPNALQVYALST